MQPPEATKVSQSYDLASGTFFFSKIELEKQANGQVAFRAQVAPGCERVVGAFITDTENSAIVSREPIVIRSLLYFLDGQTSPEVNLFIATFLKPLWFPETDKITRRHSASHVLYMHLSGEYNFLGEGNKFNVELTTDAIFTKMVVKQHYGFLKLKPIKITVSFPPGAANIAALFQEYHALLPLSEHYLEQGHFKVKTKEQIEAMIDAAMKTGSITADQEISLKDLLGHHHHQ